MRRVDSVPQPYGSLGLRAFGAPPVTFTLGFMKMTIHLSPRLLIAFLAVWATLCVACYALRSELAFIFAYFILPTSALVVPLVIAALSIHTYRSRSPDLIRSLNWSITNIPFFLLASIAYLLSYLGLARLLEIPWRQAKFGESLDLGVAASSLFLTTVVVVLGASLLALRYAQSRSANAAAASIGMLSFTLIVFIIVASSPLVQWRA